MDGKILTLYAVTDRSWLKPGENLAGPVEELLKAGVTCDQLREKSLGKEALLKEAGELLKLCRKYKVPLIINDYPEIAKEVGADGVHVGISDMGIEKAREFLGDGFLIGGSAHNVQEALAAQRAGADYIGCGAVFGSSTKADVTALSHGELKAICQAVEIPVVAIGGIDQGNIKELAGTGIDGVAAVSALFAKEDKASAAKELLRLFGQIRSQDRSGEKIRTALTIAGCDSSGGAGIQADIKTMMANGVYAMSAVSALTAQNTTGVYGIMEVSPEFLEKQLDCVFTDIYPNAVKIGMLSSAGIIRAVAGKLKEYRASHVVLDPVMVSTSGSRLIREDAASVLQEELFPLAEIITPNIPEAEVLTGQKIPDAEAMERAARQLWERWHCAVLCKGGHRINDANDLLCENGEIRWIEGKKIDNPNTHGTGCTLSSAIASNLAKGYGLYESVRRAKDYLSGVLSGQLDLGRGAGPMNHAYIFMK